ncbi:MAG: stage III sporulation protein AB [Acutalibacteraceae bacterium]
MLKFFCFVIVSACGTMLGLEFRRKLSVRLHSLIMFQSLFTEIKGMISYSGYTLNEIMCELSALHPGNKFILKCSEYTLYQSFKSAWKNTLESMKNELCLSEHDTEFLCQNTEKMGRSDVDNELDLLDIIISQISVLIREADDKLKSNGKIYTAVGSACGIITALIFI